MYDYLIATDEGLEMAQEGEKENDDDDDNHDDDSNHDDDNEKEDSDLLDSSDAQKEDADLLGSGDEASDAFSASDKEDDFSMSDEDDEGEEPPMLDGEEPVATPAEDYAIARGIDFESGFVGDGRVVDVSAVINYTLPTAVASYIHRIGRTARAEKLGTALSFVDPESPEDTKILTEIQKHNPPREGHPVPQRLPFDVREVESFTYR